MYLTWSDVVKQSAAIHPTWGAEKHLQYLEHEGQLENPMVERWLNEVIGSRATALREVRWFMTQPAFIQYVVNARRSSLAWCPW